MPHNKTITIFILCLGVVVSVWLFTKKQQLLSVTTEKSSDTITVEPAINIKADPNDDWKKMLTSIDSKNQKVTNLTSKSTEEDDTTLTDQMARDFLSQYLLAVKSGTNITSQVANQIAQNTLTLPEYAPKSGAVYIRENLKVTKKIDELTVEKYKNNINQILKPLYYDINNVDTLTIIMNALQTENENELKKLDPVIVINKAVIKGLLEVEVPESAVKTHLSLLNASSNILFDLESLRVSLKDPVKGLPILGQYPIDLNNFAVSLKNMDLYLLKNS